MSDSFDVEEVPTRPAAAAGKSKTSRWSAVANTALQRGFGRLSEGDFDQGNLPDESGTHVVAAPSESETPPASPPSEEPLLAAPQRLGPRGTVRIEVAGLRGPSGTMRMAPVRAPRGVAAPERAPWLVLAAFALLSVTALVTIVAGNRGAASTAASGDLTEPAPSPPVGPSDPAQPPGDLELLDAPAPLVTVEAVAQPPRPHAKAPPRWKPRARTHRPHAGANVF